MASDKDPSLARKSIDQEIWREYEWEYFLGTTRVICRYRINKPQFVYIRSGGTTHRVVDGEGIAHCIPAPGSMGCVLRWLNPEGEVPVNF
jgi:hypothetical protein